MASKLDLLKTMTTIVADTGDMESIRAFQPTDCTTNPTLILKAAQMDAYSHLVDEAISWGMSRRRVTSEVCDRLAVNFGAELTRIVPGRVSTEVDADLSFDIEARSTRRAPDHRRLRNAGREPRARADQARRDLGRHPRRRNPPGRRDRLQHDADLQRWPRPPPAPTPAPS